jgi:hypothetical protein
MAHSQVEKNKTKNEFAARLVQCLQQTGRSTSPTHLAAEFNAYFSGTSVHMHACRKWLLGESIPTQEKLVVLAQMLGVTAEWLRYGVKGKQAMEVSNAPYIASSRDVSILRSYQRLSLRDQQVVASLIKMLLKNGY